MMHCSLFLFSLGLTFLTSTHALCTLSEALDEERSDCTLTDLPDDVLYSICIDRGFEISDDNEIELTHEVYVEAARQCLELEAEMERLLDENPELRAELEAAQEEEAARQSVEEDEIDLDDAGTYEPDPEVDPEVEREIPTERDEASPEASSADSQADSPSASLSDLSPAPIGDLSKGNMLNPAGITLKDFVSEFKAKVQGDMNMLVNTIVPAAMREPVRKSVAKALKVTRETIMAIYVNARRYILAISGELNKRSGAEGTAGEADGDDKPTGLFGVNNNR